jgi:hypothetical protein
LTRTCAGRSANRSGNEPGRNSRPRSSTQTLAGFPSLRLAPASLAAATAPPYRAPHDRDVAVGTVALENVDR